jgi:hypothetical protein
MFCQPDGLRSAFAGADTDWAAALTGQLLDVRYDIRIPNLLIYFAQFAGRGPIANSGYRAAKISSRRASKLSSPSDQSLMRPSGIAFSIARTQSISRRILSRVRS